MRLQIGIAVLMVATAITAFGQAPACATAGDKLTAFNTERREPFSGVLTTIPPNPALYYLVPGLENGTLEIREKLDYNLHYKVVGLITFVIDVTAPFPTSAADLKTATIVERALLGVNNIITSCSPLPALMFTGTVAQQSYPLPGDALYPGGWGVDITGAAFALSFGYTTDDNPAPPGSSDCAALFPSQPPLFNVTESVAGVGVAWAPCAVGTLSFKYEH